MELGQSDSCKCTGRNDKQWYRGEKQTHTVMNNEGRTRKSERRPLAKYTKRKHEETNTLKGPISTGRAVQEKRLQRDRRRRNGTS